MRGGEITPDFERSERGDDDGRTLVIDDDAASGDDRMADDAGAPARRRPLPRLRLVDPSHPDTTGARIAGGALTLLFLLGAAFSVTWMSDLGAVLSDASVTVPEERVVYWTPESLNPESETGEEATVAPTARTRAAASVPAGLPSPLRPAAARDSVEGGEPSATPRGPGEGLLRPMVPAGALPSPGRLGSAAAGAAARGAPTGCAAPCREAAAVGVAPGTELARRDSILQSRLAEVVERAGPAQKPAGFQVGLPGGGPTKEERQRDSTLHAQYRARLQALMQRYDSARADSIARGLIKPATT